MTPTPSPRRPRADRGTIRDTEADIPLLRFIAEHKAVDREIVQWLRGCGPDAAGDWADRRMIPAGYLATIEQATDRGQETFYWVKTAGMQRAGLPYGAERPGQLIHARAMAVIHLWLDAQALQHLGQWRSERQIRREIALDGNDHQGVHVPDGVFRGTTAIEFERHAKHVSRTMDILHSLLEAYHKVIYVVAGSAASVVQTAVTRLADKQQWVYDRVCVVHFDAVQDEVRQRFQKARGDRAPASRHERTASAAPGAQFDYEAFLATTLHEIMTTSSVSHSAAANLVYLAGNDGQWSNQDRWRMMVVWVVLAVRGKNLKDAREVFEHVISAVQLDDDVRTVLAAIALDRLVGMLAPSVLADSALNLPVPPVDASIAELTAVRRMLGSLDWQTYAWHVSAAIGATYERHGDYRQASQHYHELLLQDLHATPEQKAQLLIALARITMDDTSKWMRYEDALELLRPRDCHALRVSLLRVLITITTTLSQIASRDKYWSELAELQSYTAY